MSIFSKNKIVEFITVSVSALFIAAISMILLFTSSMFTYWLNLPGYF